jgi:hypothetical protein
MEATMDDANTVSRSATVGADIGDPAQDSAARRIAFRRTISTSIDRGHIQNVIHIETVAKADGRG